MSWRNHRSCLRRILKSGLDSHRFLLPPLQWKMVAFLKGLTPLHLSKKPFMSLVADNGTKRLDGYIIYGSVTEDILTGFKMHCRGWKSVYCMPKRPAFKGSAPINLSDWLHQVPRWALGSVEIFLSRHCPLWYAYGGKLKWLERLAYINTIVYPFTLIPLLA